MIINAKIIYILIQRIDLLQKIKRILNALSVALN